MVEDWIAALQTERTEAFGHHTQSKRNMGWRLKIMVAENLHYKKQKMFDHDQGTQTLFGLSQPESFLPHCRIDWG